MNERENTEDKAIEMISFGADLAGSVTGGVIGFIAAGPIGAGVGAATGSIVTEALKLAGDFAYRQISRREKVRVGAGLTFALAKISQYLEQGYTPRKDEFFDSDVSGRSASDEILEGVLIKCKNESQEKKVRFFGNIYGNTAFMPDVSLAGANWLLQKAEELTYRQLCLITLIEQAEDKGISWGQNDGDPAFEMEYNQMEFMIARDNSKDSIEHFNQTGDSQRILGLSRIGKFCYRVMGLSEIPEEDLRKLAPRFPRAFKEKQS